MIEPPFDTHGLLKVLLTLSPSQRLAFGLACGERMYPNYAAFAAQENWGEPRALRRALDLIWRVLVGEPAPRESIAILRQEVVAAEPDTEDFGTVLVSPALDAAASVGLLLQLLEDDDPGLAVEIASLSHETVAMRIQVMEHIDPSDDALEEKVQRHQLMQSELRRQRDDLRELGSVPWTPVVALRLREAWRNPTLSNIRFSEKKVLREEGSPEEGSRDPSKKVPETPT